MNCFNEVLYAKKAKFIFKIFSYIFHGLTKTDT